MWRFFPPPSLKPPVCPTFWPPAHVAPGRGPAWPSSLPPSLPPSLPCTSVWSNPLLHFISSQQINGHHRDYLWQSNYTETENSEDDVKRRGGVAEGRRAKPPRCIHSFHCPPDHIKETIVICIRHHATSVFHFIKWDCTTLSSSRSRN